MSKVQHTDAPRKRGRPPLPARRTVGSAFDELADLLGLDRRDQAAVWAELARAGVDDDRLRLLADLLLDERKASRGGRPSLRGAVDELRAVVDCAATVVGPTRATRAIALVLMLRGWKSPNGIVTLDQAPLFNMPDDVKGPRRLALLAKRVHNLTYPPTPTLSR